MTHKDIYTKFMIEYDKANVTSSYPSLTPYEIATILDKAYLALITQKVTGNNPRQAPFEIDIKAIEDIRPLITLKNTSFAKSKGDVTNRYQTKIPKDSMFVISSLINVFYNPKRANAPMDKPKSRVWPIQIVSHETAQKFFATPYNMPWVKQPVSYIEGNVMYILVDSMWRSLYRALFKGSVSMQYIKYPAKFALSSKDATYDFGNTLFELSDSMVEELINLAIIMALENVESTRLQAKAQMRSLES